MVGGSFVGGWFGLFGWVGLGCVWLAFGLCLVVFGVGVGLCF